MAAIAENRQDRGGGRGVPGHAGTPTQDFWSNFYNGLCAFRLRKFNDAEAAFHTCIALTPKSATCFYNRAWPAAPWARFPKPIATTHAPLELEPSLERPA